MTMLPRVTWPSPPRATSLPRRTERMVVPRYCSMSGIVLKKWSDREGCKGEGCPVLPARRRALRKTGEKTAGRRPGLRDQGGSASVRVVRDELCQLIDAHDAKKFVDKRVVAAQGDGLAAAQALHQHADELADAAVGDPGDRGPGAQHVVVGGGRA